MTKRKHDDRIGLTTPEETLGRYCDEFSKVLDTEGYSKSYKAHQCRLVTEFGKWLQHRRIPFATLRQKHVTQFLESVSRNRAVLGGDADILKRFLEVLTRQGVIPEMVAEPLTPITQMVKNYGAYLREERNLSEITVYGYLPIIRRFLIERFDEKAVDCTTLCAADIVGFVRSEAARLSPVAAKLVTTVLRSFLGYLRYRGEIHLDLTAAVPTVPIWSMTGIPRAIAASDATAALAYCHRDTPAGCRDYAILLLLARLGLRASEIVSLTLESIDWQAARLTVRGKGGQQEYLPLPTDVGEAIANYLQHGRPQSPHRALFLRIHAPNRGFRGPSAISCVVGRALARARIDAPRKGAHQFRHALACQLLHQGASLVEIGALLRHRTPQTTAIYAKVDVRALRALSLPWPGGVQ